MGTSRGKSGEHERDFAVRLPSHVLVWVAKEAGRVGKTPDRLLAEMITGIVEQQTEPLHDRLSRVNRLIKNLITLTNAALEQEMQERGQVRIAAKLPPTSDERKKRRDRLIELGMEAYEELRKITSSEQAAKEAESRIQAYLVMARVGAFNAAVIKDQETEDISNLIIQVEEQNEEMEEELEKVRKKRREMERIGQPP